MILLQIKQTTERLQQKNYKSVYLAFLRVAISLWLLKEVYINWSSLEMLYGQSTFFQPQDNFINRLKWGNFPLVKNHYMWFIISYIMIILLNILGIGRWLTALLLLVMVHITQLMNVSIMNNGNTMAKLVLLYLVFADSYQYLVLFKQKTTDSEKRKLQNLLSNLASLSIMIQLCVAYFASGLAKINNPIWLHGEATYYAMSLERYMGTSFNKYIVQHKWIDIMSNYATMFFELFFPILVWIKKMRGLLLITGIIFHVCIYIFLMIYGFQIVFVLLYGLFLPNDKIMKILKISPKVI